MALTENCEIDHYIDQELRSFRVGATRRIYKGSLVGLTSDGYVRALAGGDLFVGVAYEEIDNSAGSGADACVRVYTWGVFGFTLNGVALTDIGRPVFASADDTLMFSAPGNSYIGLVQDRVAANEIMLRIDPTRRRLKTITHPMEDLAAGADVPTRAIRLIDTDSWIVAARIVNQATAAVGIDDNTCVVTVAIGVDTVATATFDSTTGFPAPNTHFDLGVVSCAHIASRAVLTVSVINGVNANPGPFLLEVDYV